MERRFSPPSLLRYCVIHACAQVNPRAISTCHAFHMFPGNAIALNAVKVATESSLHSSQTITFQTSENKAVGQIRNVHYSRSGKNKLQDRQEMAETKERGGRRDRKKEGGGAL
jgi:hypothetical protein